MSDIDSTRSEEERSGSLAATRPAPNAFGADVSVTSDPAGVSLQTWAWPAGQLADDAVPLVLQMIEGLGSARPGRASVVQGSVTAERVSVSYEVCDAPTLAERADLTSISPLSALLAAEGLVAAVTECEKQGVPIGRWDPALLHDVNENEWALPSPGLHALPLGRRPRIVSVIEAAACAPEAATGAVDLSSCAERQRAQAEAYAIGATLYWALSGALPLDAEHPESYCRAQLESTPKSLLEVAPHLERYASLIRLVDRCLSRSPEERPASHIELAGELAVAAREADRLENAVSFFPLRVSDSQGMDLPARPRRASETNTLDPAHKRRQILVLAALIGLLLFLVYYQVHWTDVGFPANVPVTSSESP